MCTQHRHKHMIDQAGHWFADLNIETSWCNHDYPLKNTATSCKIN